MRKIILASLTALTLTGCKTTEANYKAAYEAATAHGRQETDEYDPATRRALERSKQARQLVYIVGNDTIDSVTMFLSPTDDAPRPLPRFGIAVRSFSQLFNAKAMCQRWRENGFPGAYVMQNAAPVYYVVSAGTDTLNQVPGLLQEARERGVGLGMGKEFPQLMRTASR